MAGVYQPKNFAYAIQVFLEDFALAIFFVRLRAALGAKGFLVSAVTVAFLFSAAHYPAKLSGASRSSRRPGTLFWTDYSFLL